MYFLDGNNSNIDSSLPLLSLSVRDKEVAASLAATAMHVIIEENEDEQR